jgi:uncharacterized membrane protein YccF (DUF307 family)
VRILVTDGLLAVGQIVYLIPLIGLVLFVGLPTGQATWHISPSDLDLFEHVPAGAATWDGHSTDEKYERVDRATRAIAQREG